DVADVLMDAEDFLYHQDDRHFVAAGRAGEIDGQLAAVDRDPRFAGVEPFGVGADHALRLYRLHGEGEAGRRQGGDEAAAAEAGGGQQAVELGVLIALHRVSPRVGGDEGRWWRPVPTQC